MAWELELTICSLITEQTPEGYLDVCRDQAKSRGIDVFNLNFNEYESPLAAFAAEENRALVATLECCRRKTLDIFEGADALAPLECNETFWLRSLLINSNVIGLVVIFLVTSEGKVRLFQDSEGAFYRDCVGLN
ncbi:hypothetical protein DX887_12870 [Vibrio alginolyticus]|uniref:hypothetical protein n=1 Tax=Vibrio alginolyticus TaxID=663 RepID=UPI0006CA913D|nr:hypothetical protein [Vibrio alginolyticus]EGR2556678.1 hypothetical protein [Vibrio alginolyticus]EJV5739937.1 hypothetical protein [Vibrio alginolyticus]KPM91726.1 hypothetical protein AOR10_16115 [Vibrio alginolyticus]MCR9454714.1 hypothetical protein [Vibrio alginolyticus]MCR9463155.1 hypothetical protein [Vibrio alginolyticus]